MRRSECDEVNATKCRATKRSVITKPDEKEILIISFTVFKVIKIKQNDLDDSTAPISIEIELEECEDPNDNKDESESGETLRTLSISSCDSDIKDTQSYVNFKQRNYLLYGIIGVLMLLIVVILSFIFIFTLVLKNNPTENTINMPPFVQKEDNEIDYHLP
ncbi:unnamed protein product [Rotaria magnacalcarata]|uniref:Uncharacterized protein n=1 Tax=Rotaria magnacalcarata TaxID=392030 RepID=A0A814L3P8_9BILA|nr:unnamed protein product [Rotaria magnacalcarata]CAF1499294.1 unnamed protein product [Rotaria magnacalcarata]CAF2052314.1 unnamed protein product [Rotaria magnacalcarata]CAF2120543.1 unnamed protein product [Rotaria magnacalcarata]CAF2220184.1 unnamed protein product [Rotaria magnacalcarata]